MSGVNNAAEDDQVTVRPRSLACESHAPPTSTLGASVVRARRRNRPALGSLRRTRARPRADDGRAARSQHADDLAARRLRRGTVTGADPLWTYTEEGAAAFYPLAVVPLARGAERPQGQRKI